MLPTPDCSGRNAFGMRPARISEERNSATFWPIFSVIAVGSRNSFGLVRFSSSAPRRRSWLDPRRTSGEPTRSEAVKIGISCRAGGSSGSKRSCIPSSDAGWLAFSSMMTLSASRRIGGSRTDTSGEHDAAARGDVAGFDDGPVHLPEEAVADHLGQHGQMHVDEPHLAGVDLLAQHGTRTGTACGS